MKKFTYWMVGILLGLTAIPAAFGSETGKAEVRSIAQNPVNLRGSDVAGIQLFGNRSLNLVGDVGMLQESASVMALEKRGSHRLPREVANTAELAGTYVLTYKSLASSIAAGGRDCVIAPVEGKDSITITNFWDKGVVLKAGVDVATGRISIPNQVLATTENYGDIDFATCLQNGAPDRSAPVTGKITEDGMIVIDGWWGVYVVSGENKDGMFGAYYETEIEKANGEMGFTTLDGQSDKYGVIVTQTSANVMTVKNFANYGKTVEILLSRDERGTITSQLAREDKTNGDWYTFATTYKTDGSLESYAADITLDKSTDKRKLTWGNWTLMNVGGTKKYYLGARDSGYITTPFDIKYPTLSVTEFEGEGTESSPYLIKKLDDLILLSDRVNEVTDYPYTNGMSNYARVFLGKFFRLENDIDMTGYRFEPIGNRWSNVFAGSFDGNGKTIKGLTVSTGASGYAALFGLTDTLSVVKDLRITNAEISSADYYAAAIAGWSRGTIENCHVSDSHIYNTGLAAAALAGITTTIRGCSSVGNQIEGLGGFAAGVAGEVDGSITDCFAEKTVIYAGAVAEGYPSGGVVGQLYNGATLNRCYFSGTLQAVVDNCTVGGVAGSVYKGVAENCFNVGNVYGLGTKANVGGVVGMLSGTLKNSYNVGLVQARASRQTGGITGYVSDYSVDGEQRQAVVESCYSAGQISAETYQYDKNTEVRESLGSIKEGTTPTIANVYFDRQMTDLTSLNYGATTAQLTAASGPSGFPADVWEFTDGYYPRLKVFKDLELSKFSASAIVMPEGTSADKVTKEATLNALGATRFKLAKTVAGQLTLSDEGYYSRIAGNSLQLKDEFGTDTLAVTNGDAIRLYLLKMAPIPFEGEGTEEKPYLVKTKDDLILLSNVTTYFGQFFPNTYFRMTNDIDLEYSTEFKGICALESDAHNRFAGHFDGGGFTIHKMKLDAIVWETTPDSSPDGQGMPDTGDSEGYKGFIGRLDTEGSLKNLNMAADCQLLFWATSAAFVGYNYGTVENCRNYADISGLSCWIGGIVGQHLTGATIRNCYNAGNITSGYMDAGGICGSSNGFIENCMNVGNITVMPISKFITSTSTKLNFAGGIAGSSNGSVFRNVVNAGMVKAVIGKVGGISGSLGKSSSGSGPNDMHYAVNYGSVFAGDQALVGAIAGTNGTAGELNGVFYDVQISSCKAAGNLDYRTMSPLETSVLTSGIPMDGFSEEIWSFEAGKYPVLKLFEKEDLVVKSRQTIILIPSGQTVKNLSSDVALAAQEGLAWTLQRGDAFKIEEGKLKVPAEVESIVSDTLMAIYGAYKKSIEVMRVPSVPLTGSGTETDPYLITSADDWNNLVNYMTLTVNSFDGSCFKVTQNIDFTGKTFVPMACDGVLQMQSVLDGNGMRMYGISYKPTDSYQGVFGTIGEKGVVKNLTLAGEINSTETNTGGFCGELYGQLVNCINELNVTNSKSSVAGFCAMARTGSKLTDCVNRGVITGKATNIAGVAANVENGVEFLRCGNEGKIINGDDGNYTAGLVGTSKPSTYIECYNSGTIELAMPASTKNVAGLIAYANAASGDEPYVLTGCRNSGDVQAAAVVAGLVAMGNSSGYNVMLMTNCHNEGDILSTSTKAISSSPTAGISCWYTAGSVFENCSNSGTVMSTKNVYAAGIAGYYKGSGAAAKKYKFLNCTNTGDIIASGNQGGGIVAYAANHSQIVGCSNFGNIEGGFGLGGIVGCFTGVESVMSGCFNAGKVTTSTYRAGGLIGYNAAQSVVTDCFNVGDVSSTSELQGTTTTSGYGIGGIAGEGGSIFTNCYNMGSVKGASQVGGLIGYPDKGKTQLISCYNAGRIVAPADTCANLIGVNLENGKKWNEENVVKDSYYVTDYGVFKIGNVSIGEGKTIAELSMLDMGEGFVPGDDYTMPIIRTFESNDYAKAFAASVVVKDGNLENVTGDFKLGAPEGVVWTSSVPNITIQGNDAVFSDEAFAGEAVLTATCGNAVKTVTIVCDKADSGVESTLEGKRVVSEIYYSVSGIEMPKPDSQAGEGAVYLVKRTYDDGTTEIVKMIR